MMRTRSLKKAALENVPGVFPLRAVVSDLPQTRSSWSVSQDMENRNDYMPERAFVLGKHFGRCVCFLVLLLALFGQTTIRAQSANHLASKPAAKVPDSERTEAARPAQLLAAPLGKRATAEKATSEAPREERPAEAGTASATQSQFRV